MISPRLLVISFDILSSFNFLFNWLYKMFDDNTHMYSIESIIRNAVFTGQLEIIEELINNTTRRLYEFFYIASKYNIDIVLNFLYAKHYDEISTNIMFIQTLVKHDQKIRVLDLLKETKNIMLATSALNSACYYQKYEIVEMLVKSGVNDYSGSSLKWAVILGNVEIAKLLIDRGADIQDARAVLESAAKNMNIPIIKYLLSLGVSLTADEINNSPVWTHCDDIVNFVLHDIGIVPKGIDLYKHFASLDSRHLEQIIDPNIARAIRDRHQIMTVSRDYYPDIQFAFDSKLT